MDLQKLYKTNPNINKSDVKILEKWMETQPHLPKTEESMIIIFLNGCELNLEKTKTCIEYYYTIRASFPAVFADRDPELPMNLQGLNVVIFEPFPQLTPKGHVVFYSKLMDLSVENYDYCVYMKLLDMRIHAWLRKFGCARGLEIVIDMEGASYKHWQKSGFLNARKVLGYLCEGFPMQLKMIHYVNPSHFLNAVLSLLLPLCPKSLKQCISVHSNINTLFDALPKYCIPNELNGTGGSIEQLHRSYIKTIKMNREYFIDDEHHKSDESKRIKTGLLTRLKF